MAARYVNTENVAAQGQSFYTGLLPGSYEKGGGTGGSNVMGKGSGGSAGVTADRTASDAAKKSIAGYPKGGTILGKQPTTDSDRLDQIAKNTAGGQGGNISARGPAGGQPPPQGPFWPGAGGGTPPPAGRPTGLGPAPRLTKPQQQGGGVAKGAGAAVGVGVGSAVTANTGNPALGKMAGTAAGAITEHGLGKMGEKLSESPIGQAVQGRASTRQQTRQSGVQQSATQQSIPFPNMPNSTNRSLNF